MSAYMVDKYHIAYLVEAGFWEKLGMESSIHHLMDTKEYFKVRIKLANILSQENAKSIAHRYPDTVGDEANAPGDVESYEPWTASDFKRWCWHEFDPVQIIKSCKCYSYQACEHPEWESSTAHKYITMLKEWVTSQLPGYDDAEWGAPLPSSEKIEW